MRHIVLIFLLACGITAVNAQTTAKPATHAAPAARAATATGVKLPPGVPPSRVPVRTAFSLRYQDIKVGTGAVAEPNKMYKVQYTGWLAADGHKFDSSYDHRMPIMDKDGKPVMGDDGKPKLGDAQPFSFPQGFGRLIPGFDQGLDGMKVGGKRRIFIPWQLAYGARGRPGPNAENPGIPPKADLIFDVELLDVTDMTMPAGHPGMGGMPGGHPMMPHPATAAPGTAPAPEHGTAAPAGTAAQPATAPQPK
jgi:peptidylprolyl isomerase